MNNILKKSGSIMLSVLMLVAIIIPISAESEYPEYFVTEEQVKLVERGYKIEDVLNLSDLEIEQLSNITLYSSGYVTAKTERVAGSEKHFTKENLGVHPDWKNRNAVYTSRFYFNIQGKSTIKASLGISTGGTASFSISVSKSASSGGWVSDLIDASRASKPMMYGTGYTYRIKVVEYDGYTNDYLRTYYLNSVYISAEGARGTYY